MPSNGQLDCVMQVSSMEAVVLAGICKVTPAVRVHRLFDMTHSKTTTTSFDSGPRARRYIVKINVTGLSQNHERCEIPLMSVIHDFDLTVVRVGSHLPEMRTNSWPRLHYTRASYWDNFDGVIGVTASQASLFGDA
eukprot:scaffold165972_cov12-Prasinocladus_malaysianus.AAC.1